MRLPEKKAAYGEVPDHFRHFVAAALKEERRPMKKLRLSAVLLAAALLLALAATALALSLSRSAQYTAAREAREAIMEKYGFTNESLGLFYPEITQADGVYTFTYSPIKYPDRFGVYTAIVREGEAPVIAWTYDGLDPALWASGEFSDPVWSAAHGEKYHRLEQAYWARMSAWIEEKGGPSLSLEDQAALDAFLLENNLPGGIGGYSIATLPSESDIQEAEAVALAKQAAIDKFGVTAETLDLYHPHVTFSISEQDDEAEYIVALTTESGEWDPALGEFRISLRSPSGFVNDCFWRVDKRYRTLPDGPLDAYHEAIREYVDAGALFVLPHAEKAALAERITKAGYRLSNRFLAPGRADISEAEAVELAKKTLFARYGLTDGMLSLFMPDASFQQFGGSPAWIVGFVAREDIVWPFPEHLGEYWISIVGETGEITQAYWTLDDAALDPAGYTENTWGGAPAWDASVLPWAVDFDKACQALDQLPEAERWSFEGAAEADRLFRDAGFDRTQHPNGIPGPDELTREQAFTIAKEALLVEFGMTESEISSHRIAESFSVADPDAPVWAFHLYIGSNGTCSVFIDARTGEVTDMQLMTTGNG